MSTSFATVQDVADLWRPLTADETTRAAALLPLISDMLRQEARKVEKNLDQMIEADPSYGSVVKMVTVLGYSWSGTYAVPGGGAAASILNNDLKRLGLLRQRVKAVKLWPGTSRECR